MVARARQLGLMLLSDSSRPSVTPPEWGDDEPDALPAMSDDDASTRRFCRVCRRLLVVRTPEDVRGQLNNAEPWAPHGQVR